MQAKQYNQALKIMEAAAPDLQRAYKLLKHAEGRGDVRAIYALATWHLHGKEAVVGKNLKIAIAKLKAAAQAYHADAAFDLAVCYEKGEGVRKSERRAFEYYLMSALWGDQNACFEVARFFEYGMIVQKSSRICDIFMKRAEVLGLDLDKEIKRRA